MNQPPTKTATSGPSKSATKIVHCFQCERYSNVMSKFPNQQIFIIVEEPLEKEHVFFESLSIFDEPIEDEDVIYEIFYLISEHTLSNLVYEKFSVVFCLNSSCTSTHIYMYVCNHGNKRRNTILIFLTHRIITSVYSLILNEINYSKSSPIVDYSRIIPIGLVSNKYQPKLIHVQINRFYMHDIIPLIILFTPERSKEEIQEKKSRSNPKN
jgi:hypothetical protein